MRRSAARLKHVMFDEETYDPEDWELRYRSKTTGRENRVIFWCHGCGYREKPKEWPQPSRRICPQCTEYEMRFVAYEGGVEDAQAVRVIEKGEWPDD